MLPPGSITVSKDNYALSVIRRSQGVAYTTGIAVAGYFSQSEWLLGRPVCSHVKATD